MVIQALAETTHILEATNGVDFTLVLSEIVSISPSLLPVAVGCAAFRKAIGFMFGIIRGA